MKELIDNNVKQPNTFIPHDHTQCINYVTLWYETEQFFCIPEVSEFVIQRSLTENIVYKYCKPSGKKN